MLNILIRLAFETTNTYRVFPDSLMLRLFNAVFSDAIAI
jgi:hypothetical protein